MTTAIEAGDAEQLATVLGLISLRQQKNCADLVHPTLILRDLKLIDVNSREILAIIEVNPNLRRVLVIVLTTSSDESDILSSYQLNVNCYLTESIDPQQWTQVI